MHNDPSALTPQQKAFTLAGTLLAMFLAALDQTVVSTAGPQMQTQLHMDASVYTWITTAYLVASTVLVPVYGKLSDLYGRKRIILVGITIFLVASMLCGVSQNAGQLIAFRALQGCGSASLFTSAFAIVADLFPPSERGKYSGLFGAVFGVSSLIGPLLGGFITDHFGWHWVFFINLPLGLIAVAFILLRMPPLKKVHAQRPRLDVLGAVLLAVGTIPFLVASSFGRPVVRPGETGFEWTSAPIIGMYAVAVAGLVGFVWWQLRAPEPLIELRLFKNPTMSWASAVMFVMGATFLMPMVFLPLYMVNVVGVSNTQSGLTISPLVMGIVAGNVLSGQLVSRIGRYKPLMLIALVVLTVGFAVLGFTLHADSTQGEVTAKMILVGLGLGPSIPLYTLAVQNAVPVQHMGVATSMATFFRQMGSTVGVAFVGSLFATTLSSEMASRVERATQGLPPQMVEQLMRRGPAADGEGAPATQGFDAAKVEAAIDGQLDGAKAVAMKAVRGEALATQVVASSGFADDRLKALAMNGGAAAQVKKSHEGLARRIEQAMETPASWQTLQAAKDLPVDVMAVVQAIPAERVGAPLDRQGALMGVKQALAKSEAAAVGIAERQAMEHVDALIEGARAKLKGVAAAVGQGMKESLTVAVRQVYQVAMVLAFLALLLTLRLPQLSLRKSNAPPPHALVE